MLEIVQRMEAKRAELGLTKVDFVKLVPVAVSTYGDWVNLDERPGTVSIDKCKRFLNGEPPPPTITCRICSKQKINNYMVMASVIGNDGTCRQCYRHARGAQKVHVQSPFDLWPASPWLLKAGPDGPYRGWSNKRYRAITESELET